MDEQTLDTLTDALRTNAAAIDEAAWLFALVSQWRLDVCQRETISWHLLGKWLQLIATEENRLYGERRRLEARKVALEPPVTALV
jgi:hypothetical protein